jgi:hypothetical protein
MAVHDVGVHEGQVYIVSDYLDGPDLGWWLREHRPAWPEAARIVAAVAAALADVAVGAVERHRRGGRPRGAAHRRVRESIPDRERG